mmetsp:Transcript_27370/g.58552  ORF Transcript_27370/g.58552 Transcript_27370/m.58552 type:complete len:317 (+) Transcript_27370:1273-2223(+)
MSGQSQVGRRNAHFQVTLVVDGTLGNVQRFRDDQKPLREVVDHEIHNVGESGRCRGQGTNLVGANNGGVLRKLGQQALELCSRQGRRAEGVGVSLFHHLSPGLLGVAPELGGDPRELGIKVVERSDHVGLVALDVQEIVEDRRVAVFHGPRTRRISNPVVAESHADRGHNDGWLVFVTGLFRAQDLVDGDDGLSVDGTGCLALRCRLAAHVESVHVGRLDALQLHGGGSCVSSLPSADLDLVHEGHLEFVGWVGIVVGGGHERVDVAAGGWVVLVKVVRAVRPTLQKFVDDEKADQQGTNHYGCPHESHDGLLLFW